MTRILKFCSAFLFIAAGCDMGEPDDRYIVLPSHVFGARVTGHSATQVRFIARAGWYGGGGRFARAEVLHNDTTVFITVYGMQERDAISSASPIEFDAPVTVQIPFPATYTFRFWPWDTHSYDTTFAIP
jgi:hypothetical protein